MTVIIRLYDDHRTSAEAEGGYPTIYLCDECAEKRGGDVTHHNDPAVGEELYCADCGNPNQAAEEEEVQDAEARRQEAQLDALQDLGVVSWEQISGDFTGSDLLLGNGFSINLSSLLAYDSLFEEFLHECSPVDAEMFRRFETTNFERIQEQLLDAKKVNTIFELPTQPIDMAVQKLREGLVKSIESNHPRARDIDDDVLYRVSEALDPFEDVFTFSYDLFLYRIIMKSVERANATGIRKHNDYFWHAQSEAFLEFMDFDIYENKYVYYLHGALFLFPGYRFDYHNDLKLRRGDESFDELIDIVSSKIKVGKFPLFVSEGKHEEKLQAIFASPYLRFAYRKLEESKRPLVVYGWSISPQDKHILRALSSPWRKSRRLAVSVYAGGKTKTELEQEIAFQKANLSGHKTVFFDSSTLFAF